jgi:hypothetical protein
MPNVTVPGAISRSAAQPWRTRPPNRSGLWPQGRESPRASNDTTIAHARPGVHLAEYPVALSVLDWRGQANLTKIQSNQNQTYRDEITGGTMIGEGRFAPRLRLSERRTRLLVRFAGPHPLI